MQIPPLDELLDKVPSKYALAVLAAKRARTLTEGQISSAYEKGTKPVTVALHEIGKGKIGYEWIRKRREPDQE